MRRTTPPPSAERRLRGFEPAFGLMTRELRKAGESRGFAVAKLLTHWDEVAGPDLAAATRPVKMGYGRDGIGATLTVLVQGAVAPLVEMQKDSLRQRVNAVYGYNAVARIHLTQTAPTGFAEGQAPFAPAPRPAPAVDPKVEERARRAAGGVADQGLRDALERLGQNIFTRRSAEEDDA